MAVKKLQLNMLDESLNKSKSIMKGITELHYFNNKGTATKGIKLYYLE